MTHQFTGKNIPHIDLNSTTTIKDLIEIFCNSGYNAKQLGRAAKLYEKMIQADATICLTISGALTPVGFGGIVQTLIREGLVDWIITTGANVYHESHFSEGLPVKQGSCQVDDNVLYQKGIVRIYDIFIKYWQTLECQDQTIQDFSRNLGPRSFTTAEFCHSFGKYEKMHSKHKDKNFVICAHDFDVPVFVSTLKDSSLALNLAFEHLNKKPFLLDFMREIIQQASIVCNSKHSGIIELGGGAPKNLAEQLPYFLSNNLLLNHKNYCHDYVVQITDAREDDGGMSGSPFTQQLGWHQIKPQTQHAKIFCDSTIAFPILAMYVLAKSYKRKPKRLYKKLDGFCSKMKSSVGC